jgi:ribonucleoside-diphosphate reductase alpha chain
VTDQATARATDQIRRPPADLPEPDLTPNGKTVLETRYLSHTEGGKLLETPGGAFWRVASEVAQGSAPWESPEALEQLKRDYYMAMAKLEFLPNSPTLMNAGKGNGLQYSACYVLPVPDSMQGIF